MPILVLKESAFNGTELRSEYVVVADASTGDITTVGRTREADEAKGTSHYSEGFTAVRDFGSKARTSLS